MNQSLKNQRNLKNMFKPAMSGFFAISIISFIMKNVMNYVMSRNINYIKTKNNLKNWIMAFRGS